MLEIAIKDQAGKNRNGNELLTPAEVADLLGTTPGTLNNWRAIGRGPRFEKAVNGWDTRYRVSSIVEYLMGKPWTKPSLQTA